MSAETKIKSSSSEQLKLLTDPINDDNPVTVQILGVCSALAVTSQVYPALIMALGVTLVTAFSNLVTSALRNTIPSDIRMIIQLLIVAALVQVVEMLLGAFAYSAYEMLSVFIGLIITNCIVMGRLEAYAMKNKPWQSFLDGIGNGLGYGFILVVMAVIREFFGKGSFMGWKITPDWFVVNNLMVLPCASLFLIGIIIWIQRGSNRKLIDIS